MTLPIYTNANRLRAAFHGVCQKLPMIAIAPLLRTVGLLAALLAAGGSGLARTEISGAEQPQLFSSADGRVWLTYAKGVDLFATCSTDAGVTFAPAVKIAGEEGFMVGMRCGPRIVADGDRVTVTVIGRELLSFHSTDGGRTWSTAESINEVPGSAREGLHDLTAAPGGKAFVTWLDLRSGRMELWGARSSDGGQTWSRNELVYRSPEKSVCECCHPSALFDATGRLAVMWRNSLSGNRDLWLGTGEPGTGAFSSGKLGTGSWKLDACPMDGGDIIAFGNGSFATVWQRAGEVFYCEPGSPEVRVGKGRQPVAVAYEGRAMVVWQEGNRLMISRDAASPSLEPRALAVEARYAVLITAGNRPLAAYEQGKSGESRVVVEQL
jgi:hypothetical protein